MPKVRPQLSLQRILVIMVDLAVVTLAFYFSFLLRFEFDPHSLYMDLFIRTVTYPLLAYLFATFLFGPNRGVYYVASFTETMEVVRVLAFSGMITAVCVLFISQGKFPRSIILLHPLLTFIGLFAMRVSAKQVLKFLRRRRSSSSSRKVILVGAGNMGEILLLQLLNQSQSEYDVLGIIDDDPLKWGMRIHGVPVLGGRGILPLVLKKKPIDEIIIAIAANRGQLINSVMKAIRESEVKPEVKIAPSLGEMLRSRAESLHVRKVRPVDLLNRPVVRLDAERIDRALKGKVVLVSGAGGTIGSELCRQALRYGPSCIILLENHATALFYRDAELRAGASGVQIVPVLGDVRDIGLLDRIFRLHRPQVVLHAAAHKHVHQLEFNVQEGVSNNTLGTYRLASAADRHGAEVFLLVSTDKAVRPSSVMGATKRAAEVVVSAMAKASKTRFVAVRFGNVLGSSGSVLKIFQEQIAAGGPITVTDAGATRYFMTVEESVGLILQAASMARSGDVFVLNMGEPVRIMDMARNLILLSGLEPDSDIEIKVTGLKQGEKPHEELVEDPAGVDKSDHPEIMRLRSENDGLPDLAGRMLELEIASRSGDSRAVMRRLQELVPTFRPDAAHAAQDADDAAFEVSDPLIN